MCSSEHQPQREATSFETVMRVISEERVFSSPPLNLCILYALFRQHNTNPHPSHFRVFYSVRASNGSAACGQPLCLTAVAAAAAAGRSGSCGEAVMSLLFTDEEFQLAWKELDEPQVDGGWELFTETMGVKIYRLFDKVRRPQQRQPEASDWFRKEREREKKSRLFSSLAHLSVVTADCCDVD